MDSAADGAVVAVVRGAHLVPVTTVAGFWSDPGAWAAKAERLVPLGLLAGATVVRDVGVDHLLTYDDVEIDSSTTISQLRALQDRLLEGHDPAIGALAGIVTR